MEGFVAGRITRSRRGKLYIDDSTWGPEADSVKSGYRVPIGSIHIFIGKTDGSEPEPDLEVPMETSSRRSAGSRHTFVGFIDGSPESAHSVESLTPDASKKHLMLTHTLAKEAPRTPGPSDLSGATDLALGQQNTTRTSLTSSLRTASLCSWQTPKSRGVRELRTQPKIGRLPMQPLIQIGSSRKFSREQKSSRMP